MVKRIQLFIFLSALCFAVGCQTKGVTTEVVKSFPINSMEGVLTQSGVMLDTVVSSDGKGSLKMNVTQPTVVKLFEVSGVDLENARLVYRAHVKTENVVGKAYLEMWCVFPGLGEYFSRSLQNPLQGTADWSILETP